MLPDYLLADRATLERVCQENCATVEINDHVMRVCVLGKYTLYVDKTDEGISPHLGHDGFWEAWITLAMARQLKPGAFCLDVGANQGYYTMLMAGAVGPQGKVVAIEPNPDLAALLERSVKANQFDQVRVLQRAVTDTVADQVRLIVPPGRAMNGSLYHGAHSGFARFEVETVTLDHITAGWSHVDLIKIDVEGAEQAVWRGMRQTLEKNPTAIVIMEICAARYEAPEAFLADIEQQGYALRYIDYDGNIQAVTVEQILQRPHEDWILFLADKRFTRAAEPPRYGLNIIGDVTADSGLGESTRITLNAIHAHGTPISYLEFNYEWDKRVKESPAPYTALSQGSIYPINLMFYNLTQFAQLSDAQLASVTGSKYTIAFWVWELPQVPVHMRHAFERIDEVWTASRFCQRALSAAGSKPVVVIPHPIEIVPSAAPQRAAFGIPDEAYVFLYTFAATSCVARKNPWAVINAFKRAFGKSSKKGPLLVLKAHHLDVFPAVQRALRAAVDEVGGVLLQESYTRQQVNDLMACADVYVSLHRAEGFGLGMAEAMYLGKPVVATYYSANQDYMTIHNSYPVNYVPRRVMAEDFKYQPDVLNIYGTDGLWAEPDVGEASSYMTFLYENPEHGSEVGQRAAADIRRYCSPAQVAHLIAQRLHEINLSPATGVRRHSVRQFPTAPGMAEAPPNPQLQVEDLPKVRATLQEWNAMRVAQVEDLPKVRATLQEWNAMRVAQDARVARHWFTRIPAIGFLYKTLVRIRYLGRVWGWQHFLLVTMGDHLAAMGDHLAAMGDHLAAQQRGLYEISAQLQSAQSDMRAQVTALKSQLEGQVDMFHASLVDRLQLTLHGPLVALQGDPGGRITQTDFSAYLTRLQGELDERITWLQGELDERITRLQGEPGGYITQTDFSACLTRLQNELGQTLEAKAANLETRLAHITAQLKEQTRLNTSYIRLLQRHLDPTPNGSLVIDQIHGATLLHIISRLEQSIPMLAQSTVDISIQGSHAETALLAVAGHFTGRFRPVQPDVWYHVDYTANWQRAILFQNALHKVPLGGYFVVITNRADEQVEQHERFALVAREIFQEDSGSQIQALVWQLL